MAFRPRLSDLRVSTSLTLGSLITDHCSSVLHQNHIQKPGPCTPLMRVISISAVALGPEIHVTSAGDRCREALEALVPSPSGPAFSQRSKYSGNVSTTWLACTTHRCQSGSRVDHPPPFHRGVMQHNRPRLGNAAESTPSPHHRPARSPRPAESPSIFQSNPGASHSAGSPAGATNACLPLAVNCARIAAISPSGSHSTTSASYSRNRSTNRSSRAPAVMLPRRT